MANARGVLVDRPAWDDRKEASTVQVRVEDQREANTLYNKGAFGLPQSGGALVLDLDEALYLVEQNRLEVAGEDAGSLVRLAASTEDGFEIRYIVYRDLRGRGLVVKRSNLMDYNCYNQGSIPGRTPSKQLVRCVSERDTLVAPALVAETRRAMQAGKRLLLALVDEEGDLTYYDTKLPELTAAVPALPEGRAAASLLEDRVIVFDAEAAAALHATSFFGRDVGLGLQLALPEAVYLAREGRLDVRDASGKRAISADDLAARARTLEPDFDLRQAVYRHLRQRGVVVKTGFKYGTHFRAYTGAPSEEHAPYLVHALPAERGLPWPEVAGFVRLAHGVRKRLFFATPDGDSFALVELARKKP